MDDAHPNAHIGQKSHIEVLDGVDFFLGQPGGVFNGLLNVLALDAWIILENFLEGRPVRNLAHNHGRGYLHSPDACSPAHDVRIKRYPIKHDHHPLRPMSLFSP
jgi:hypothetical protein